LRPRRTAIAFALAAALLFAMVAALSAELLRLDREGREARRRAGVEEAVRLALWRMDSAFTPVLARENARPPEAYVFSSEPAGSSIRLHFRADSDGVRSPEASGDDARLAKLRVLLAGGALERALPASVPDEPYGQAPAMQAQAVEVRKTAQTQQANRGLLDWNARAKNVYSASNVFAAPNAPALPRARTAPAGVLSALWLGDELVLAKRADDGSFAGAWLDWPALRSSLLAEAAELLPAASLRPAPPGAGARGERLLASLPAQLVAGAVVPDAESTGFPVGFVLAAAWIGVLLALLASGALLAGSVALGERRAAFVSAVTHELRTPLTTLRMYAEMLAAGMVPDEARRREYLSTLDREATRLGRLVENVLAWSRVEQGRRRAPEPTHAAAMLGRILPLLEERARQAGLTVTLDVDPGAADVRAMADEAGVGQVLFNLVDNACKYADSGPNRRVEVSLLAATESGISRRSGVVEIVVCDFGPGLSAAARRRLFVPFSRPAQEAAGSAPGVGLGLALCRRLARSMGGTLRHEVPPGGGARFVLRLRQAARGP